MSCYLVQETDGTSRFTLEDGSGSLLLEFCPPGPPSPDVGAGGPEMRARRRRREMLIEEEDLMSVLLSEL